MLKQVQHDIFHHFPYYDTVAEGEGNRPFLPFQGGGQEGDGFWIPLFTGMKAQNGAFFKKLKCFHSRLSGVRLFIFPDIDLMFFQ
jgi:hypothetical protein